MFIGFRAIQRNKKYSRISIVTQFKLKLYKRNMASTTDQQEKGTTNKVTLESTAKQLPAPILSSSPGLTMYQLFDGKGENEGGSSTFTYLISCDTSKRAILIDPVLEQVERDSTLINTLGLSLRYCLNTHCHADHVTGSGQLKQIFSECQSCISQASGAKADIYFEPNQKFEWAPGHVLNILATPGHTSGCVCFYDSQLGVFTGDTLMIGGCGRTDFQEGDADQLYDSVYERLFVLPDDTIVYPAHDYKGNTSSTIGVEKTTNPRLSKTKSDFVKIMENLNLSYPGKIDIAVPANMKCGVF
jgi:sulfur dioxygenase